MNKQDILNNIKSGNTKSTDNLVNGINSLPTDSIKTQIGSVDDLKNKIPSKDDITNSLNGLKDKIPSIPKLGSLSKFKPIKPIKLKQLPTPNKFKNKKTI